MNKVILLGRLTKDVELRYTQTSNMAVASFSIAVNQKYVKEGEERRADFFNIVAWNKLAENASKYLKKGSQVVIVGRLQNRSWQDEQDNKHTITEVIVEEMEFIDTKKEQNPDVSILTGQSTTMPNFSESDSDEVMSSTDELPF